MSTQHTRETRGNIWKDERYAKSGNRYVGVKADEETLAARGAGVKHDITGRKKEKSPEKAKIRLAQQKATLNLHRMFLGSKGFTRNEVETRLKNRYEITKENSPDWLKLFIFGDNESPEGDGFTGSDTINNYMRELFCQGLIEVK